MTNLVIWGSLGLDLLSAHMADKANPFTEGKLAVGAGDEGDVILRTAGSGFPGLPRLLCCIGPVGLVYLGTFVHGGTPLGPVHGGLFPGVGGDGKRFQGCF